MAHIFTDEQVQNTADDAITSKLSAASMGYYDDEFVGLFHSTFSNPSNRVRRSPLIHRGYYSRVAGVEEVLRQFLSSDSSSKQIVSLGSGFDTTYFRLKKRNGANIPALYIELDYERVCRTKKRIMRKHKVFSEVLGPGLEDLDQDAHIHCGSYHLMSADLRYPVQVESALLSCGLDWSKPTLFLSECVLVYVNPQESFPLIEWIASQLKSFNGEGWFVIYEQIRPNDPFGKVMMENLRSRGCPLLSLTTYPLPEDQENRFRSAGWSHSCCRDMNDVYRKVIPTSDRERIEKLEMFDEFEEWYLIQAHYSITVSVISKDDCLLKQIPFFSKD